MTQKFRWPQTMPDKGRVKDAATIAQIGAAATFAPTSFSCARTIHISLFFDGTNNNDDEKNAKWRDSKTLSHTNVARLFNACKLDAAKGQFRYYIPGVGTPFTEIDEKEYSANGKSFATGFAKRVGWAYTRVLNGMLWALSGTQETISNEAAYRICGYLEAEHEQKNGPPPLNFDPTIAMAQSRGIGHALSELARLKTQYLDVLRKAQQDCQANKSISKVWINVFGFSRGAAEARVFVHKLIQDWMADTPGQIAGIPVQVNFVGLFDTVASVGLPDSSRGVIDFAGFDGHWAWTDQGGLNVPASVRRCVHFVAGHEQRMSFPVDSIREGAAYPGSDSQRLEVVYPGVHSDIGGGYPPKDQGKARGGDAHKLSQIPLHDMYIEALKAGVLLHYVGDRNATLPVSFERDFEISPILIATFNAWLPSAPATSDITQALAHCWRQGLAWRALRAQVGTPAYVTAQAFFKQAPEDVLRPPELEAERKRVHARQLDESLRKYQQLRAQFEAQQRVVLNTSSAPNAKPYMAAVEAQEALRDKIRAETARLHGLGDLSEAEQREALLKDRRQRPGEGADELVSNDQTDLQEAAEEFRVLLASLHPLEYQQWAVEAPKWVPPANPRGSGVMTPWLVKRAGLSGSHKPALSRQVKLVDPGDAPTIMSLFSGNPSHDVLVEPTSKTAAAAKAATSAQACRAIAAQAPLLQLFDDYLHDSRAWFRVPYHRELAPGGYAWQRVVFIGNDTRVDPNAVPSAYTVAYNASKQALQQAATAVINAPADMAESCKRKMWELNLEVEQWLRRQYGYPPIF